MYVAERESCPSLLCSRQEGGVERWRAGGSSEAARGDDLREQRGRAERAEPRRAERAVERLASAQSPGEAAQWQSSALSGGRVPSRSAGMAVQIHQLSSLTHFSTRSAPPPPRPAQRGALARRAVRISRDTTQAQPPATACAPTRMPASSPRRRGRSASSTRARGSARAATSSRSATWRRPRPRRSRRAATAAARSPARRPSSAASSSKHPRWWRSASKTRGAASRTRRRLWRRRARRGSTRARTAGRRRRGAARSDTWTRARERPWAVRTIRDGGEEFAGRRPKRCVLNSRFVLCGGHDLLHGIYQKFGFRGSPSERPFFWNTQPREAEVPDLASSGSKL